MAVPDVLRVQPVRVWQALRLNAMDVQVRQWVVLSQRQGPSALLGPVERAPALLEPEGTERGGSMAHPEAAATVEISREAVRALQVPETPPGLFRRAMAT